MICFQGKLDEYFGAWSTVDNHYCFTGTMPVELQALSAYRFEAINMTTSFGYNLILTVKQVKYYRVIYKKNSYRNNSKTCMM